MADTVILTMSEFGRAVGENGNRGTDHGHGNAMMVIGGGVLGRQGVRRGRRAPRSVTRAATGRHADFRDVFGEIVVRHLGVSDPRPIFPGYAPTQISGLSGSNVERKRAEDAGLFLRFWTIVLSELGELCVLLSPWLKRQTQTKVGDALGWWKRAADRPHRSRRRDGQDGERRVRRLAEGGRSLVTAIVRRRGFGQAATDAAPLRPRRRARRRARDSTSVRRSRGYLSDPLILIQNEIFTAAPDGAQIAHL